MKNVLIILETDTQVKPASFEILSHLQQCKSAAEIHACSAEHLQESDLKKLAGYGVSRVYCPDHSADTDGAFLHLAKQVAQAAGTYDLITATATDWGNMVLSGLCALKNMPVYENCQNLAPDTGEIRKPMYGDKVIATVAITWPAGISFRAKSFVCVPPCGKAVLPEVCILPTISPPLDWVFHVKGAEVQAGRPDILEADVVIAAGRGIEKSENLKVLEQLVALFAGRAGLGASRVVVDQGWTVQANQVGQTGKTVAPTLYIACGISGAVQHQVGMNPAKYVIAINKDPEAAIFAVADYGVVEDLLEFVPLLAEELAKRK